tara:strand:+ start:523 stop:2223 length:1701 start_codon:yes stop_codon:yes gene_type:complete
MIIKLFNFIFNYSSSKEYKKIILIFILSIVNILLQLSLIIVVYFLISRFLNINDENLNFNFIGKLIYNLEYKKFIFFAFVILFLNIIINSVYVHQSFKQFSLFTKNIEQSIFSKFIQKQYNFYKHSKSYDIVKLVIDNLPRLTLGIFYPVLILFSNFITFLTIIIALSMVNFLSTISVSIGLIILVLTIYFAVKNHISNLNKIESKSITDRANLSLNAFNSFREIKIYNLFDKINIDFNNSSNNFYNSRYKTYFFLNFPKYLIEYTFLTGILTFFLFFDFSEKLYDSLPTIGFILMAVYRLIPCFGSTLSSLSSIRSNFIYFNIILEELNKADNEIEIFSKSNERIKIEKINLNNLNYFYGKNNIYKNFNLEISKKDKIYLRGDTGSGKSTLLDIISGLNAKFDGNLIINGKIKLTENNVNILREKVSYTTQNPYIFEDSIKQNIILFDSEPDYEKLNEIIKVAKVDKILSNKNINIDEKISEKGINFSGGEKQRINIARSLYKNFDILILDESTNSLNEELEEEIIKNTINFCKEKILIVCSHNTSLKKYFSKDVHIKKINNNNQ